MQLTKLCLAALLGTTLLLACCLGTRADSIQLSSVLTKLQAIHEDTKSLLIKNVELKNTILAELQQQNEAKIKQVKEIKSIESPTQMASAAGANSQPYLLPTHQQPINGAKPALAAHLDRHASGGKHGESAPSTIDYAELEEFNKWVETNLEYAVKNTQATAEALKEEAQHNNGNVEYSEQAIKDGIEGVKYWQSAVIFQDKTLKNEEYVAPE